MLAKTKRQWVRYVKNFLEPKDVNPSTKMMNNQYEVDNLNLQYHEVVKVVAVDNQYHVGVKVSLVVALAIN